MANRRVVRRAAVRRPTFWQGSEFQALPSIAGVDSTVSTILTEVNMETVPNGTIVRVRGSYCWTIAGLDGTGQVTMGMMLVNGSALAVGIGSLPTPFTDIGSDWLWWDTFGIDNVGTLGDGPALSGQRMIDSKAMRKITLNKALVLTVQIQGIGAANGIATIAGVARVLTKR